MGVLVILTANSAMLAAAAAFVGFVLGAALVWRMGGATAAQAQAALLRQDHEWFRTTLANIRDGVIASNADGKATFLNAAAQALTGWTPEDARGKLLVDIYQVIDETTRQPVESAAARVLREGTAVSLTRHILVGKDGTETSIEDSAAPVKDEADKIAGVVLVLRQATGVYGNRTH